MESLPLQSVVDFIEILSIEVSIGDQCSIGEVFGHFIDHDVDTFECALHTIVTLLTHLHTIHGLQHMTGWTQGALLAILTAVTTSSPDVTDSTTRAIAR